MEWFVSWAKVGFSPFFLRNVFFNSGFMEAEFSGEFEALLRNVLFCEFCTRVMRRRIIL